MPVASRRLDAERNRARIVAAARAALAVQDGDSGETGDVALHLIAKAAAVGQGTLYRHFPTREHLLAEVYRQEVGELVAVVPGLLAHHTPVEALERWLDQVLAYARVKRGVIAALEASAWRDLYDDQHQRIDDALERLLDAARATGRLRDGVDAVLVLVLLGGLTRIPADQWELRAPALVRVIVDGITS